MDRGRLLEESGRLVILARRFRYAVQDNYGRGEIEMLIQRIEFIVEGMWKAVRVSEKEE